MRFETKNINELTNEEYELLMSQASIQGAKLFFFGLLTIGIYPIIWHLLNDRK